MGVPFTLLCLYSSSSTRLALTLDGLSCAHLCLKARALPLPHRLVCLDLEDPSTPRRAKEGIPATTKASKHLLKRRVLPIQIQEAPEPRGAGEEGARRGHRPEEGPRRENQEARQAPAAVSRGRRFGEQESKGRQRRRTDRVPEGGQAPECPRAEQPRPAAAASQVSASPSVSFTHAVLQLQCTRLL